MTADPLYLTWRERRLGLCASGALFLPDEAVLVVADLHLEKGSAYAARGQLLPPYDTRAGLLRLEAETARLSPRRVILLGDSFHDAKSLERLAEDDRRRLDALAERAELVFVAGNHDEALQGVLPGGGAFEVRLGDLVLRHEAEVLDDDVLEVSGHYHPVARVSAAGRGVRRRCFVTDGRRLILPAFGAYAGGLNVLDPALLALFSQPLRVFALSPSGVVALDPMSLKPDLRRG